MSTKKRIRLTVAYDGTDFCGFAPQRDQRTVHGTLTEAVRRATGEDVEIVGASRTDGGAHALGAAAHFDTSNPMPAETWRLVLNMALSEDCRIVQSQEVSQDFHARFSATSRVYRYRFLLNEFDPFRRRYTHAYWKDLDVELMQEAARSLLGEHDFRGYTEEVGPEVLNTRRKLFQVDLNQVEDEIHFEVDGIAFLRGMMRRMAGMLFEIGRGHRPLEDCARLLTKDRDEMQWPVVLPAKGLTLIKVNYETPGYDARNKPWDEMDD
ncbi:MAG: tRNA pseudouridine(38-40) synthase TruA [Chlorobia bacterium]|nr:tRNA pseudouridine(38-40) synthase TruA [Fimbriimonadaceae bacterium]